MDIFKSVRVATCTRAAAISSVAVWVFARYGEGRGRSRFGRSNGLDLFGVAAQSRGPATAERVTAQHRWRSPLSVHGGLWRPPRAPARTIRAVGRAVVYEPIFSRQAATELLTAPASAQACVTDGRTTVTMCVPNRSVTYPSGNCSLRIARSAARNSSRFASAATYDFDTRLSRWVSSEIVRSHANACDVTGRSKSGPISPPFCANGLL